jgi:hypothetical protein
MKQKVGTFNGTDKEREKKDKTWGPWKTWHGLGLYASWFLSTSPHCYNGILPSALLVLRRYPGVGSDGEAVLDREQSVSKPCLN